MRKSACWPDLHSPWPAPLKTAVLKPWFELDGHVRIFKNSSVVALERFRPEVIAGPAEALRSLAEEIGQTGSALAASLCGLIAFTSIEEAPMSEEARDLLWRTCQAPVFEQLRGLRGELLAMECEAHEGLHFQPPAKALEGWATGSRLAVEEAPCACGRATPRLVDVRSKGLRAVGAAAGDGH
jgi:hypothetical protein